MTLKDTLRYLVLGGIFCIPLIPFIISGSMFFPYITGKNFVFRILVEFMAAAWIILMLLDAKYRPRFSLVLGGLSAFIVSIFISDLMSLDVFKSIWSNFERMEGFVTLFHLYLYFIIAGVMLSTQKLWTAWWNTSIAVSIVLGIIGLKELYGWFVLSEGTQRIDSTFGNPTYLAIYALFHIFIALILLVRYRGSAYVRWVYIGAAVLQLVMLYFTGTRGAMLGFLGAALLTGCIVALLESGRSRLRTFAIGAVASVVILVAGFALVHNTAFVREAPILNRFSVIGEELQGSGTVASRFMIWNMAWQGVKEKPIFGWGQEGFIFVFSKYYNPQMFEQEPWFDRTHNIVFDWLIAGGFVGALLYFSVPVFILYYLWIYRRDDHPLSVTERALWTGALAGYFFHNLFVFDNLTSYLLYIALLAYLHVQVTRDREPLFSGKQLSPEVVRTIIAPIVLILVLVCVYYINMRGIFTAGYLVDAIRQNGKTYEELEDRFNRALAYDFIGRQEVKEQMLQTATMVARSNLPDNQKTAFIEQARAEADKELSRVPNNTRMNLFMASFLGNVGRPQEGLTYALKAYELAPTKQAVLFEVGARYLDLREYDKAVAMFKEAHELAPEFGEPLRLYALSLVYSDRFAEARVLLEERFETMAIDDNRFVTAYDQKGHHDLVIQILQQRVEKNPTDPQLHVSLAAGYLKAGNREKAIELIRQAISMEPKFTTQGEQLIADIQAGKNPLGQ